MGFIDNISETMFIEALLKTINLIQNASTSYREKLCEIEIDGKGTDRIAKIVYQLGKQKLHAY